jgi:hypothetical protein
MASWINAYAYAQYSHLILRVTGLDSTTTLVADLSKNSDLKYARDGGADVYLSAFYTWDAKHVTDSNSSNFMVSLQSTDSTLTKSLGNTTVSGGIMINNKGTAINQVKAHKSKNGYIGYIEGGQHNTFTLNLSFLDGTTTVFNSGGIGILHLIFKHRSTPLSQQSQLINSISHARLLHKNINLSFDYGDLTDSNVRFTTRNIDHPTGCIADVYLDMFHTYDSIAPTTPDNAFFYLSLDNIVKHTVTNSVFVNMIPIPNLATGTGQSIHHLSGKYTYLGYIDINGLSRDFTGTIHIGDKSTILRSSGSLNMSLVLKYREIMS